MQQLLAVLMFPFTINTEQPYVPPCSPEHWEHGSEQNRPKSLSPCSRHGGDRRSTRYRVKSIVSWIMTEVLKKKRKMGRKRRGWNSSRSWISVKTWRRWEDGRGMTRGKSIPGWGNNRYKSLPEPGACLTNSTCLRGLRAGVEQAGRRTAGGGEVRRPNPAVAVVHRESSGFCSHRGDEGLTEEGDLI